MSGFVNRWSAFALAVLIGIDQLAQTLIVGLWWWLTGRGHCPDPDETISAYLGRKAGRSWAVLPAALIDALFLIITLGRQRNHCAWSARNHGGQ